MKISVTGVNGERWVLGEDVATKVHAFMSSENNLGKELLWISSGNVSINMKNVIAIEYQE